MVDKIISLIKWYLEHKAKKYVMWTFCEAGLLLLSPNIVLVIISAIAGENKVGSATIFTDALSYIGVFFVLFGPLCQFILFPIVGWKFKRYSKSLEKLNNIFSVYGCSAFKSDMENTYNNCLLFIHQRDKMGLLIKMINDDEYSIQDDQLNALVKKFGKKLETFRTYCAGKMKPYNSDGDVHVPFEERNSLVCDWIHDSSEELISLFQKINSWKMTLKDKSFFRFFL